MVIRARRGENSSENTGTSFPGARTASIDAEPRSFFDRMLLDANYSLLSDFELMEREIRILEIESIREVKKEAQEKKAKSREKN